MADPQATPSPAVSDKGGAVAVAEVQSAPVSGAGSVTTIQIGGGPAAPATASSSPSGAAPSSGGSSSGKDGSSSSGGPPPDAETRTGTIPLTEDEKLKLISFTAWHESRNNFGACNRDIEFYKLKNHWAYQKHHLGLSYGFIQFMQDCGSLGKVLTKMKQIDANAYAQAFGEHSEALLAMCNAKGPSSKDANAERGPRTQPVGGHDTWEDYWVDKFKAAGSLAPMQRAQKELAIELFLNRQLDNAKKYGMDSQRAICMLTALAIGWGNGGAASQLKKALGEPPGPAGLDCRKKCEKLVEHLTKSGQPQGRRFAGWIDDNRLSDQLKYTW